MTAPAAHRRLALAERLSARRSELNQAVRLMVAVAVSFAFYELFHLPQGYWAVFTVIIVMQGSIGGTLGVSIDRMIGTATGAVVGGTAAALVPHHPWPIGITLVVCVGLTALLAAVQPRFKVAPITVAIMLLSTSGGLSPQFAALYRVVEIGVGGLLGVLATLVILPAPSGPRIAARAAETLDKIAEALQAHALAMEENSAGPEPDHTALRRSLSAVEEAMADAERERTSRLSAHPVPAAIPRTLWRVRNDLVSIGRFTAEPLPASVSSRLGPAAAALMRCEATLATRCAAGLRDGRPVSRSGLAEARSSFEANFAEIRKEGHTRMLDFDAAGRVFGLTFALESLRRNLSDFADRVDELAAPSAEVTRASA